jgi:galactokinase
MSSPRTFRAPGRVNLIGEHTDYNLGFVLPIALNLATYVETRPSPDGLFHLWSDHRQEKYSWPAAETATLQPRKQWSDYVAGVAYLLAQAGVPLEPLEMSIRSDVPEGSGLSSSAALEVSSALAFLQGRDFPRPDLAKLCQRAEMEFVGMPCGIMDQFVSLFGQTGAAIRIDCRSLRYQAVTLPPDIRIVAVNSMVKHELGASAYRIRVAECAEAARAIGVASLRDATLPQVEAADMDRRVRKRARYIVTENLRVQDFVAAAAAGDAARMGRLFNESHAGMRDEYEISCEEIDFLAETARVLDGCYGSRMTGGGFGGCTVNLVRTDALEAFRETIAQAYQARFGVDPVNFLCIPGAGAAEMH